MKAFFKELFDYHLQSNQSLITKLLDHAEHLSPKIIEQQCHIINAHQVWNSRLLNTTSSVNSTTTKVNNTTFGIQLKLTFI